MIRYKEFLTKKTVFVVDVSYYFYHLTIAVREIFQQKIDNFM